MCAFTHHLYSHDPLCFSYRLVLAGMGTEGGDALTMPHYCFLCAHRVLRQGFHLRAYSGTANLCYPFLQKGTQCHVLTWICSTTALAKHVPLDPMIRILLSHHPQSKPSKKYHRVATAAGNTVLKPAGNCINSMSAHPTSCLTKPHSVGTQQISCGCV